jgi:NADH dehydrogenase
VRGPVVVTGAFGYSGRHIARRLLARGERVRTLTNRPLSDSPFGDRVDAWPLRFEDGKGLTESLRGADALVNTYWVRFDHGDATHRVAIENTRRLIDAAVAASVRRVVHVSITKPSEDSPLPYFRGKALLEQVVRESGLSHAILRPAVLFGEGDVLVNNIAWMLRRLPVFGLPGRGRARIRPIHVDDLAALAVSETRATRDVTLDAVGPETYAFADLVRTIRDVIGVRTLVLPVPRPLLWLTALVLGRLLRDVVLTRDEIRGLSAGLLATDGPSTGRTVFSEWLAANAEGLGREYANELSRHWRKEA